MKSDKNPTVQKLYETFAKFKRTLKMNSQNSTLGLKSNEIHVLFYLKKGAKEGEDGIKVSDISNRMSIASPSVTQMINGLEENGYVERSMDKDDRRVVRIKLTAKGEDIIVKAEEIFENELNRLVEYLGENKSNELIELMSLVSLYFQKNNKKNNF
ncbi:MAG: MarR family transcriptional regulator [Bacillota bacterium]|nr:MarR family transcriptional regulator [Bacillota bacterium]